MVNTVINQMTRIYEVDIQSNKYNTGKVKRSIQFLRL